MAIKVRSRWRLLALVIGVALLGLMVPAQAVTPTVVQGNSNCASVGSIGELSLTLTEPFKKGTQSGTVDPVTITFDTLTRTGFSFTIEGGVVYDVIVKGSAANHYHYDGGTVTEDDLVIPNGNKLNVVHFCYTVGEGLECGGEVTTEADPDASGTFTRDDTATCSGIKLVEIEVREDNTIVFIPQGGDSDSTYHGTITFTKDSSDGGALVLLYDPVDDGVDDFTREVPDCAEGPSLPNADDTWCVISADAVYNGNSSWTIEWLVYGEGDPTFK